MNICEHVESLRLRLLACRATRAQLAQATGGVLSASWLSKFAAGRMHNPRLESLVALDRALTDVQSREAA